MSAQLRYRAAIAGIVPPHILEAIARNGTPAQRAIAQQTLATDDAIRSARIAAQFTGMTAPKAAAPQAGPPRKHRVIDDTKYYSDTFVFVLPC